MFEELEAKFVESSIQHKAEIEKLKDELSSVQSVIAEKKIRKLSSQKQRFHQCELIVALRKIC